MSLLFISDKPPVPGAVVSVVQRNLPAAVDEAEEQEDAGQGVNALHGADLQYHRASHELSSKEQQWIKRLRVTAHLVFSLSVLRALYFLYLLPVPVLSDPCLSPRPLIYIAGGWVCSGGPVLPPAKSTCYSQPIRHGPRRIGPVDSSGVCSDERKGGIHA